MAASPTHPGWPGTWSPDARPPDAPLCSFHVDGRKFEIRLAEQPAALADLKPLLGRGEVGRLTIDGIVLVVSEETGRRPHGERDPAELLTARELQIASLVARGLPTKRIADMLRITDFTVATRCASILGDGTSDLGGATSAKVSY